MHRLRGTAMSPTTPFPSPSTLSTSRVRSVGTRAGQERAARRRHGPYRGTTAAPVCMPARRASSPYVALAFSCACAGACAPSNTAKCVPRGVRSTRATWHSNRGNQQGRVRAPAARRRSCLLQRTVQLAAGSSDGHDNAAVVTGRGAPCSAVACCRTTPPPRAVTNKQVFN